MSKWKQPFLMGCNKSELNCCLMILETNKSEEEDFLYYSYKTNEASASLLNWKGLILASAGIANSLLGEDIRIMTVTDSKTKSQYKICSRTHQRTYLVSVVLPYTTPDNLLVYVTKEFSDFLNLFFERFTDTTKFIEVINKFAEVLIFNISNYAMTSSKEDTFYTPLSFMPIMNTTFTYNETLPVFMVKPPLSDNLRTELVEIMNTFNSDRSVLQETLTLMDPPFFMRGFVLLYNGFTVFNTISNIECSTLIRLAQLHEMHVRSKSSHEILTCEFVFENGEEYTSLDDKKKILVTLLAQREFVLLVYLDICGKNNCSFDPFYSKRAEDILISLLKKSYNLILQNEMYNNSIRMLDDKSQNEEKLISDLSSEIDIVKRKNSETSSNRRESVEDLERIIDPLSKIKGFVDVETKVNIVHFSCYDDAECLINTCDLNVTSNVYKEVYRIVFNHYAKIQTNLNKLRTRNKMIRLRQTFNYAEMAKNYTQVRKKENGIKTKIQREKFMKNLKTMKLDECGFKINVSGNTPIWVCCKVYQHSAVQDETNFEEFSNYRIIFVAYESHSPVDIDSFCQDLIINELFI